MEIVVGGAPCQNQPGYYYLGAKRDLVLEAAGPGATGALWDPGRERGNRRSLGPSDTTRVLTFLHTLD